jgi:hypothetical protein
MESFNLNTDLLTLTAPFGHGKGRDKPCPYKMAQFCTEAND